MSTTPILLLEEDATNTTISWWNVNRAKLNEVVRAFNLWQINGFSHDGRERVKELVQACEVFGEENDFHQRQFDTLNDIRKHLEITHNIEPVYDPVVYQFVPADFFTRLEALKESMTSTEDRATLEDMIRSVRV